jgi:hypothetical protein
MTTVVLWLRRRPGTGACASRYDLAFFDNGLTDDQRAWKDSQDIRGHAIGFLSEYSLSPMVQRIFDEAPKRITPFKDFFRALLRALRFFAGTAAQTRIFQITDLLKPFSALQKRFCIFPLTTLW